MWMWELDYKERWALENWCFWTVVLERTPKCLLDCNEIQPVLLKEISTECSVEGLIRKLKLQYFGHLMQRTNSWKRPCCWEILKVGGEEDNRGWDVWMASVTQWTCSLSRLWVLVINREAWHAAVYGVAKSRTRLNWSDQKNQRRMGILSCRSTEILMKLFLSKFD